MEEILDKLNIKYGELLLTMEKAQISTFVDKGNYLVKNRTLFKESFLNGRKELIKVLVFSKTDFESKIILLLNQIETKINYYTYLSKKAAV